MRLFQLSCLTALLALIFAKALSGQGAEQPILVDEHGRLPCDDFLSRIDTFLADLNKSPQSVGLVVVTSTETKKHWAVLRERMTKAHVIYRAFTSNDIKFLRTTSPEKDLWIQYWRIPPGAYEPTVENIDETYRLPRGIKPFMLGAEYPFFEGICPEVEDLPIFAEFLQGDSNSRGNVVVRDVTLRKAKQRADLIRRQLLDRYGIQPSRIRFFPRRAANPANNLEPIVEYWYLP
jgi:hypothetical protein